MDAYEQQFLQELERVVGPTQQENARHDVGYWWFRGAYHGHPVRIGLSTKRGLNSMTVGAYLSGLPLRLLVNARSNTTILATPEVRTGDAQFDAGFLVNGFPEEVVRAVLDDTTRAFIRSEYPSFHANISTDDGWLSLGKSLRSSWDRSLPPLPVTELERYVRAVVDIAMRLAQQFHARRAEIHDTQGGDAAFAWEKKQHDLQRAVGAGRRRLRIYVFGGLGCLVLLIVAAVVLGSCLGGLRITIP